MCQVSPEVNLSVDESISDSLSMETGGHSHSPKVRFSETKGWFWQAKNTLSDGHVLESIEESNALMKDNSDLNRPLVKDEGRNSRRRRSKDCRRCCNGSHGKSRIRETVA